MVHLPTLQTGWFYTWRVTRFPLLSLALHICLPGVCHYVLSQTAVQYFSRLLKSCWSPPDRVEAGHNLNPCRKCFESTC